MTGSVGEPIDVGATPSGMRHIFPIVGGSFEGPKIRGRLLPGGADYMLERPDLVVMPDVRVPLETDDGHLIIMRYDGYRHGPRDVMQRLAAGEPVDDSSYYFRIAPRFETGSEKYSWLNRILAIGVGRRLPSGPVYDVHEIL